MSFVVLVPVGTDDILNNFISILSHQFVFFSAKKKVVPMLGDKKQCVSEGQKKHYISCAQKRHKRNFLGLPLQNQNSNVFR